jgi:hypothetical protein
MGKNGGRIEMKQNIFGQSKNELLQIIEGMRAKPLVEHCHLYLRHPGKTIGEAAAEEARDYSREAKDRPGLMLLSVVLSIHNDYTRKVEPVLNKLRKQDFKSFHDLENLVSDEEAFQDVCGGYDDKRRILGEILPAIDRLKEKRGIDDDYAVMNTWAKNADLRARKYDDIGRISGIGPAAFQHLRMNFGVNTVKPDQRVKEVLERKFKILIQDDATAVEAVETLSEICGRSAIELDQIFVNYGSGYYRRVPASVLEREYAIAHPSGKATLARGPGPLAESELPALARDIQKVLERADIYLGKHYECFNQDGQGIRYIFEAKDFKTRRKNIVTIWPEKRNPANGDIRIVGIGDYSLQRGFNRADLESDRLKRDLERAYDSTQRY